jgi:hypothetical protein
MNKNSIIVLLVLVSGLYAQLPIPAWAQWLSDDEKSLKVFTTKAGCQYEEINIPSRSIIKGLVIENFIKNGMELTEQGVNEYLEKYWTSVTEDYPLKHIQDGYKMVRIVDVSEVSDIYKYWGKVVVWEWQYTVKNTSASKLSVSIEYHLTDENIITTRASDSMNFILESGETGTYTSTNFFPIKYLEEIENRTWSISYDY